MASSGLTTFEVWHKPTLSRNKGLRGLAGFTIIVSP
jgi:hypothetical protein